MSIVEVDSYASLVSRKAAEHGSKVFARFSDRAVTYAELEDLSNAVGNGLFDLGIEPGDKLALLCPNIPEFLAVWFATEKTGVVLVPVNVSLKGDGLAYIIDHSDSSTVIVHEDFLGSFLEVRERVPKVRRVVVIGDARTVSGGTSFEGLLSGSAKSVRHEIGPTDIVAILYTSGTTGPPKGVVHRLGRVSFARIFADLVGYGPNDVLYTFLPLFHANAQVLTVGVALLADASVAIDERFSASHFWDRTRHFGATAFNYIGGVLSMLSGQPAYVGDSDNPVRFCLGPGAPGAIWESFEARFDLDIVEFWSSTEGGLTFNGFDGKLGSIGRPVPAYNDVRVVDDHDRECPIGAVGELVSKFAESGKSLEYFKMPEATADKTRGGWLRSGDLGYQDKDGFYYYVDRAKDCIRRRGENISSWEVETVLNKHPNVVECAAYGVAAEVGEEDVAVAIIPAPGVSIDPTDLLSWAEQHLAYFQVPRYIRFVEVFEKTETHRIQKSRLKEEGVTGDTWDRELAGYRVRR